MTNPSEPTAPLSNVKHLIIENKDSGRATASSEWSQLGGSEIFAPTGVWLKNESADQSVTVRNLADATGTSLAAGEDRFFPVEFLSQLQIQRGADSDVVVSWHLA